MAKGWISRVNRSTSVYFAYASGLVMTGMLFIVVYEVWMRFVQNEPVSWAIEVPELLLLTIVYLGLGYTTKVDGHVIMDAVLTRFTPQTRALLGVITSLLAAAISAFLTWHLGVEFWASFVRKWYTSTLVPIIIWPFYLTVVIGCFLMILEWISKVVVNWQDWRRTGRA